MQFAGRPQVGGLTDVFHRRSLIRAASEENGVYTGELRDSARSTTPATMTLLNAAKYNVSSDWCWMLEIFRAYGQLPGLRFLAGVTLFIAIYPT